MTSGLRDLLIEAAKEGRFIYYSDIAPQLGLDMDREADRAKIGRILGKLSEEEVEQGRPMLSAIVVHKGDETPGDGFYKLARDLGRFQTGHRHIFWAEEVKRLFEYWSSK